MRRLLLLRHAKSVPAEPGMSDRDRPLSPRGERAARLIGAAIVEHGFLPELILCSPARRTRETLAATAMAWPSQVATEFCEALYEPPSDYRAAIAEQGGDAETVLVVGHNPATQATALAFAGGGADADRRALARKYPTAGLAVIDFPDATGWTRLKPQSGTVRAFLTPADLGAGDDE